MHIIAGYTHTQTTAEDLPFIRADGMILYRAGGAYPWQQVEHRTGGNERCVNDSVELEGYAGNLVQMRKGNGTRCEEFRQTLPSHERRACAC